MKYLTLQRFKVVLRDFGNVNDLDVIYEAALHAAEATVDGFVGFDVFTEYDDVGNVPEDIQNAAYHLAAIEVDAMDPAREAMTRGRCESILRRHRREVGFAGSGSEVTP